MENMVFVCFLFVFVMLRGRCAVRLRGYTLSRFCVTVYCSILMPFSGFFSEGIALSDGLDSSHFFSGAIIFAKLRLKIAKSQKIDGKVCAHHFV